MSHSKLLKRGKSHYVESWNRKSKNYIVTCNGCGTTGFSLGILQEGFDEILERNAIKKSLQATLNPLELNKYGFCEHCASIVG